MAPTIRCTACSQPYPEQGIPFLCPQCGGVYDFDGPFEFHSEQIVPGSSGMWRYQHAFALPDSVAPVSLGEGLTPLVPYESGGRQFWLKLDSLNPTGSYKDRGSAVLLSWLLARGATSAVEDSSGNAGASFAAYAARAGVQARVFVPESASGPKRRQIEAYGAELVSVPGPRSAAAEAVLKETRQGAVYASHAYLPFGLAGIATLAYEIWQQLGCAPGTLVAPVGHGGLLLGVVRGFQALRQARLIEKMPYLVGVQAAACAPVWAGFTKGPEAMQSVLEAPTAAEGVRVRQPVRAAALLREIPHGKGQFVAVEEDSILPAYRELAARGIHVEPTAALAWCACQQNGFFPEPVVLVMTGAGLKYYS